MPDPTYSEQHHHDGHTTLVCDTCAAVIARDLNTIEPYDAGLRRHTGWHARLDQLIERHTRPLPHACIEGGTVHAGTIVLRPCGHTLD